MRVSYKLTVTKAFTDYKDKYGLDKGKIGEPIYLDKYI